ncbi:hypothetical protein BDR05DRAFT_987725 [Suillus weaverae]|nr:hypothetical protein BDR05DRAFT_987725 [Suillus weaverae]
MEGLFSLRRRASRQGPRGQPPVTPDRNGGKGNVGGSNRNRENEGITSSGNNVMRRRVSSTSSMIPPPFDMTDLGARENREPIRIGTLWYLNVHSPTPYRWQKCSALLYPHVLILSWSAPGGGRGVVSLDLINCTEVRSTPGFTHPGARGDVGGVSAAAQMTEDGVSLLEVLCPFQLLYGDGVERLAAESARERVRWVSAIWEALDRSLSLPNRSQSGSPTGSIGTIHSVASTTSTSAGSKSTVFVPPLHTIPSLSDLGSDSGGLSLSASRVPSVGGQGRTADDSSYLYPSDPRIIAPSRSSSLRRTSSLADLDEEFASAVSRARSAKPGLGFGLSLVNESLGSESGGILGVGGGSPVTVSSGPRLGGDVRVTPPPTGKIRNRALSVSEEEFFSTGSRTSSVPGSRPESDFFSADSSRTSRSGDGRTTTGLVTDGTTFEFTSGESNTQIVPSTLSYRRTESNSYLGDSHDGSGSYTPYTSSDGRSRTPFSSSDSRSRTPYSYSSSGYTSSTPYTYTSDSHAPTPTSSSLSRTPEVRRRRYGAYSTSEEPSDRENSATTRSTLSGWTRSRTPTTTTEGFLAVEERESSGSEGYTTAHASPSPSTTSFKSLPTIPSESDYQTLDTCKTCVSSEFVTAELCVSDVETDYVTAEKCKTETETDFWTAEVCKSDKEETQYETASVCLTIPSEEGLSTPRSGLAVELPAEEPIQEPIEAPIDVPIDVPIVVPIDEPIDEPIDLHEEEEVEVNLPPTPPPKTPSEVPSIISEEPALEVSITPEAVTAQEEIAEEDSLLESAPPTIQAPETPTPIVSFHTDSSFSYTESDLSPAQPELDTSVSTLTESTEPFISVTPRTVQTPALSISDHDEEAVTPSVHPSQWPSETDVSFDSSALQPTPSVQSATLQEGIDGSFETSFMRPSVSPLSSIARLTPITETISSLTPSPRQVFHPLELVSSPSSGPTPLTMSTSASSSLSRTASTVSGVSSIAIEAEEEDAVSVRAASDISTVPSLLSTRSEESVRYMPMPSPRTVPLPVSPAPTSVSMSVSVTTPHDNVPSIHSVLETEHTRTHTEQTITHDIDRLLHHIQEIDQFRGQETQEIAENVRAIRDELYDLSEYVRTRLVAERSPPVPTRDTSVGGSSVLSTPRGPRPRPGITLVEMSPPPMHPSSPSSLNSVPSFLSSHHSDDDLSLLETELEAETVERSYSISREPSWPSSSSSSSSSVTPSEISSSEPSPGPSLSATSSSSPTPPPSSPTPSTASATTVRQRDSITIETLRDMLTSLREQTTALWEGQVSTNHLLDELRETRSGALDTTEFNDRFRAIEVLLRQLIDRRVETERSVHIQPPSESTSDVGTDVDAEDFQQRWQDWTRLLRDRVPLAAPQPRRARGNLDDELLALLQAPPPQVPIGVQPPPALIPFAYQPAVRPPRSRSTSPIVRSATFPIATEPVIFSPEIQHPPIPRRPPRRPRDGRGPRDPLTTETETGFSNAPGPRTRQPIGTTAPPPGVFSDPTGTRPRTHIPPPQPIPLHGRPPSAPAHLGSNNDIREPQTWYRPPRIQGLGMPPPPIIPGQQGGRQYVPMPPGPTVVQLPLFDTLMNILREHRLAQLATVDQQRELMRYMRGLNEWLERDVQDRQAELRGVTARVDELRNDLARLGTGMQPTVQPPGVRPTMQMPEPQFPHAVIPVGPIPPPPTLGPGPYPGFVPQGVPEPPVIPTYDGSPQPGQYSPFIPDEPQWRRQGPQGMPEPHHYPPGAQGPVVPDPYGGYPQRPHRDQYEHHVHDEDEGVVPTSPHSGSSDVLPMRPFGTEHPIIVQPSDAEGSDTSTATQQTYAHPHTHHVQHPPEGPTLHMEPGHQQDIPAVVHSGEHTHSHGSPQDININMPPYPAPPPQVGMADQPVPMQSGTVYGPAGLPPPPIFDSGPVVVHSPREPPLYMPPRSERSSSQSRSSSGRGAVIIQQSPPHPSSGPIILPLPSGEHAARPPTREEFVGVTPSGGGAGGPVVRVPGSIGHVEHIHMTILIIDEVDIPTLLIITTQDVGMTVDADPTHLNMAPVAVIVTTTLPRIAVDGEGRVMTTRDRHHHDEEARDIEMMTAAAANVATDTLIHPLPHVRKKETDAGETTTLLVAYIKMTKKMSPTADVPAMTKEITHGLAELPLTELPLMCQKHIHVFPDSPRFEDHPRSPTIIRLDHPEQMHPESPTGPPVIITPGGHRTFSQGGAPPAIREDDSHHESEMVHVLPPGGHVPPPGHDPHVHFDPTATGFDDALNRQHERLDEAERELERVVHDAHEAENRREADFRHNEDQREHIFLQNEDRREAEARQRGDELFAQLEERAHSVPPLPVPPPGSGDNASIIESIHAASHEAASRHASDILDTVRLEREQFDRERESFASERERERAEFAAERARIDEERERRVHDLEEELARVRGELDGERQLRQTENEERAAANEHDEGMRAQLGDITQLVSEQRDECTRKRELMDQRWEEKQGRRAEKDAQFHELKDMVSRLVQDREADRIQEEERRLREEGKPDIQVLLDELARQNNEMREALRALSEDWRAEGERRHEDTLEAVRATAREQVPFNVQVYLDEFSKALATEVRMLLGEVGKLREERRNIQHELGYLMMMKAKYGPGGEFDPDWKPPMPGPGGPDAPPPPEAPPPPPDEPGPARPAWRTIPRNTRRIRKPRPDQPPPPEPGPAPMRQPVHSWVTWHPNPALAPTPPSIEPNLIVPDQGSPGLFGPRSPRSYR